MRRPIVHVVGAGLSGLSAAHHLAALGRFDVVVHERDPEPGGRRRAIFDQADGSAVDSLNSVVWPHWRAVRGLIAAAGAQAHWRSGERRIDFLDMNDNARWTLRPGRGATPWWALLRSRRAPGVSVGDYFRFARGSRAKGAAPRSGAAYERLWRPFSLAALNLAPGAASADLLMAALREALEAPPERPLYPSRDFGHALLLPLQQLLRRQDVAIRCERELQALGFSGEQVVGLEFGFDRIELGPRDAVVLAVPPWAAAPLAPGLLTPDEFTASITAHFDAAPPPGLADLTFVVNGPFHALFRRGESLSVTVRDAGGALDQPKETLAAKYWAAVAAIAGLSDALPAWRVIREPRAAFAATSAQNALRPAAATRWRNFVLAGGYVRSDLPESTEAAARSGERAAEILADLL